MNVLYAETEYEKAEPLYTRALAICEKALGKSSWKILIYLDINAILLRKLKRDDEAKMLEERAKKIREAKTP